MKTLFSLSLLPVVLLFLFGCGGYRVAVKPTDLSGTWKFRADPQKVGETEKWYSTDLDETDWVDFRVPGVWNEGRDAGVPENYNGYGWFRRTFVAPPEDANRDRTYLKFLAVYLIADVWLNGRHLGTHRGGYTAFEFDVTDLIEYDRPNVLVVRADNTGRRYQVPWHSIDWWNCGGISREVYLEQRPSLNAGRVFITPRLNPEPAITVTVDFTDQETEPTEVEAYALVRYDGRIVARTSRLRTQLRRNEDADLKTEIAIPDVQLWSPETPNLYELIFYWRRKGTSEWFTDTERFGMREIAVDGTELQLNGEKLFLQGVALHQDYPGMGSAVTKAAQLADLRRIKNLNANFVRLGHYPFHPFSVDVCDEIGLLTWLEVPVWQNSPEELADEKMYRDWVKPQIDEMIDQYYNHPSVIFWSVGNEFSRAWLPNKEPEQTISYVKKTTDYIRSRDGSRLVSYASAASTGYGTWEFLDVIGKPLHYGWFHSQNPYDVRSQVELIHQYAPNKPILAIEVCGMTEPGHHAGYGADQRWTMEYHDKLLRVLIQSLMAHKDYVCGVTIWTLADLKGGRERGTYGLMNRNREVKPLYDTGRQLFESNPKILILEPKTMFSSGEKFTADLWSFNAENRDYKDMHLHWWIAGLKDGVYSRLSEGEFDLDIPADRSEKVATVDWMIPNGVKGHYTLNLTLSDKGGKRVMFNDLHFSVNEAIAPAIAQVMVVNPDGDPVKGIEISMVGITKVTDETGAVHFIVPEGEYELTASGDGIEHRGKIRLKSGEITRINLTTSADAR